MCAGIRQKLCRSPRHMLLHSFWRRHLCLVGRVRCSYIKELQITRTLRRRPCRYKIQHAQVCSTMQGYIQKAHAKAPFPGHKVYDMPSYDHDEISLVTGLLQTQGVPAAAAMGCRQGRIAEPFTSSSEGIAVPRSSIVCITPL